LSAGFDLPTFNKEGLLKFFEKIAENKILEAMKEGAFDDLEGKGQPLNLADESHVPTELRMAYHILKMADCLPPELELKKEILRLQDLVASLPEENEKLRQMRRLNFFIMKLNMMRQVSPLMQEHEEYNAKIIQRLECSENKKKSS
jgi:hypothetical protein